MVQTAGMTRISRVFIGFCDYSAGARSAGGQALDKVRFGTNWVAEAEHGGFYQALADGTYKKYGLDVTIVPGGPNVNNRILLPVGKLDFFMSANSLQSFDAVEHNIPTVAVAASFQKDPQVLIAHPGRARSSSDLKTRTLFVSKEGMASYFQWLKADYGFDESKVKPYTFNAQPFLADKNSAMQGYVTSEPFAVETQGGFKPKVFLLADHGFNAYSTLIETRRDLVEKKPDLVQRFVDASAIGWYHYIYGDSRPGNELIKKQNPEMTDALLAYSIAKMKEYGIVDSGDSLKLGIGAMTDARMKSFFDKMVRAGVVKAGLDIQARLHAAVRQQGRRRRLAARNEPRRARPIVSLRNVGKTFESGTVALDGFDLDVRDGEFVSLLGPSGCGKSTALRIIAGLSDADGGHGRMAGRRSGRIGFVFQEPTLMPWADVAANVRLPLELAAQRRRRRRRSAHALGARRACADFAQRLSARIVRRHEDARLDRARAGHRAAAAADGRAVRRARRDHPLQAQQRSAGAVAGAAPHRDLRHPFGVRVGLSLAAHRGDDAAPGPRLRRDRDPGALSARRALPHLGRICRLLPAGGRSARRRRWERAA